MTRKQQRDAEHALILHAMIRLGGEALTAIAIADEAGVNRRAIGQKLSSMSQRRLVIWQARQSPRVNERVSLWTASALGREFAADRPAPSRVGGEG